MQQDTATTWSIEGKEGSGVTIGVDVGDRYTHVHALGAGGEVVRERRVRTTTAALGMVLTGLPPSRVVLEAGPRSPWLSRLMADLGHEVVVANPRQVALIARSQRKTDRLDAAWLARLGRFDPELLAPIRHRSEASQHDLAVVRARDALVRTRTLLINHVRGAVKACGAALPSCTAAAFHRKAADHIPDGLRPALLTLVEAVGELTARIAAAGREIEALCEAHSETAALRQVTGVGPITALTFVLTVEDPARFPKNREVGAYLGLVPRQRESGERAPQLGIAKSGDAGLRRLLVQAAHYILGPFGPDTDLRRWGERYAGTGARNLESTDRSLKGRAAGLPERSAGVPAFAGRCRSEEPSLSVAQRGSGALRAPARGCARRARACWREPRTRVGAVSERQAGSGNARNRARAAAHWPAQGQRFARCRVQRRAEWVSRPARAK